MNVDRRSSLLGGSDAVATYGMLTVGALHTCLTPRFKPQAGEDAIWFAGSGLALCFLGALNVLRRTPPAAPLTRRICAGANIITTGYMALMAREVREPQVYTVLVCVGVATMHALHALKAAPSVAYHPPAPGASPP